MKAIYQCLPRKDLQKHVEKNMGHPGRTMTNDGFSQLCLFAQIGYYENSDLAS